jgi:hypothetical protein
MLGMGVAAEAPPRVASTEPSFPEADQVLIRQPLPQRYVFRKASRSALIVAASVVGMPCGKSL